MSTYARGLAAALPELTAKPYLVRARQIDNRVVRWIEAVRPGARMLHQERAAGDIPALTGRDLFRNAHVHFSTWGRLYRLRSDLPPGIVHWTYPVPVVIEGWINLYTVHDAIPLERPELTPIRAARYRMVLQQIQQEAARIVTVSQSARDAIVRALECDPALIIDAGQSVDVAQEPRAPLPGGLQRKAYLLFVGSVEPRKNLPRLLAAYRRSGTELPLVIVGPDGWRSDPILREIRKTPGAIRLSYLTRAEILGLVDGARALLFPSLAEGFGLPVIEAMAVGTAVMTSNEGALAEIAGGAAALVDPLDEQAMATTIARLSGDDALVAALSASGLVRAALFTRERFVNRLRDVYADALRNPRRARKGLRT